VPESDHPEHAEDFRALAELAEVFTDLVTALRCGEGRSLSPSSIVDLAIRCMPRAQHVAITAHVDGALRDVAASSGLPAQVDRIRAETGEGPAFDLVESNDLVLTDDLNDEPRWPAFSRRTVTETGVRSIVAYRLHLSSRHRAALCFYSDWPFAFDEVAISMGAIFAAYTSLAAGQELVVGEPVGRDRSGEVHREIGVAVGILIAGSGLSTEAGYQRLHSASQVLGQSLAQTARHVIDHRRLPG
jgi:ANTAR domain